jgi:hypothetical protein
MKAIAWYFNVVQLWLQLVYYWSWLGLVLVLVLVLVSVAIVRAKRMVVSILFNSYGKSYLQNCVLFRNSGVFHENVSNLVLSQQDHRSNPRAVRYV